MAGEGTKVTAKLAKKSKTNKGILLEGNDAWFSIAEKLVSFVEKLNVGDLIDVTYIKKGTFQNVIGIYPAKTGEQKTEEPKETPKSSTGFACTVCGAELKDGKYKKCFECNKKAKEAPVAEKKEEPTTTTGTQVFDEPQKETTTRWTPGKSNYGSPEDIAGKEVGCAANCAAAILAGRPEDPETLLELWRTLFNGILEHIKLNK
jgi:hypothetical protein